MPARLIRRLRQRGTLTGLGAGVAITVPALAVGLAEGAVRSGPGVLFELAFLAACTGGALHVRRADLLAAPISAPIAFAATLVVTVGFAGGRGNAALAVLSALSSGAPWLFTGTVLALAVIGLRYLLVPRKRRPAPGSGRRRARARS